MTISGTDSLEVPIPYMFGLLAYFSGLNFREYPHNSYSTPFLDPFLFPGIGIYVDHPTGHVF